MFDKMKKQLEVMWNRGGWILTLLLLFLWALSLSQRPISDNEQVEAPSITYPRLSTIYTTPVNNSLKTSFGWQESAKTKTWRYSPALVYSIEEGKEIASPGDGVLLAEGEKIIIEHGAGYKSEIWPVRAYRFEGAVQKGESIGESYSNELHWQLSYYNEPIDPNTRVITEP